MIFKIWLELYLRFEMITIEIWNENIQYSAKIDSQIVVPVKFNL